MLLLVGLGAVLLLLRLALVVLGAVLARGPWLGGGRGATTGRCAGRRCRLLATGNGRDAHAVVADGRVVRVGCRAAAARYRRDNRPVIAGSLALDLTLALPI